MKNSTTSLATLSASDMIRGYHNSDFSPVEVVDQVLERIAQLDTDINAFITVDATGARRQAEMWSGILPSPAHPLAGVPVAIKDIIDVQGLPTTCHSAVMTGNIATRDAGVVGQLRAAGAIIIGKLSTHEFALGGPSFDLPFPPARNPWNTDHLPGGSSSGSAAAVAARMVPVTVGTDTAGSIRFPAGACGILGLKPTFGRVSCQGVFPLAYSLDHVGPLAHTASDLDLMLKVMSTGHYPPQSTLPRETTAGQPLRGLRVGYIEHFHQQDIPASPDVADGIGQFANRLNRLGASVESVTLPALQEFLAVNRVIMYSEAWAIHAKWMRERPEHYGKACRRSFMAGAFISNEQYLRARRLQRLLAEKVDATFRQYDVLLAVNMHDTPAPIDDEAEIRRTTARQARAVFSLTGHPAISLPAGISANGLPLSVQLAAPWHNDDLLVHLAQTLESDAPWPLPPIRF